MRQEHCRPRSNEFWQRPTTSLSSQPCSTCAQPPTPAQRIGLLRMTLGHAAAAPRADRAQDHRFTNRRQFGFDGRSGIAGCAAIADSGGSGQVNCAGRSCCLWECTVCSIVRTQESSDGGRTDTPRGGSYMIHRNGAVPDRRFTWSARLLCPADCKRIGSGQVYGFH